MGILVFRDIDHNKMTLKTRFLRIRGEIIKPDGHNLNQQYSKMDYPGNVLRNIEDINKTSFNVNLQWEKILAKPAAPHTFQLCCLFTFQCGKKLGGIIFSNGNLQI